MKKLLALSLAALAACQRGEAPRTDSALAADLALASQMQAQRPLPQFQDSAPPAAKAPAPKPQPRQVASRIDNAPRVRVTPRQPVVTQPVRTTPQPEPVRQAEAPARQAGPSIGAGATFSLAGQQRICTATNRPGDRFIATVSNTISGNNGATIPAGSNVVLEVVSVTPPGNGSDGAINLTVNSVELNGRNYPVHGDVSSSAELEKVRVNGESDKKKVIGGAIAGAILGQMMKKNTKGTVIGAAAGGAAGAVAAKMTEKYDGCLPVGAPMRLTLSSALVM
jgi:hypothetical protein